MIGVNIYDIKGPKWNLTFFDIFYIYHKYTKQGIFLTFLVHALGVQMSQKSGIWDISSRSKEG